MNLRAVQLQRSRPVQVLLAFKNQLGFPKHLERFVTLLVVRQRDPDEGHRFRLLVAHCELFETVGRPLGQRQGVAGKVQLEINLGFIEIAECGVALASLSVEVLTQLIKALNRSAVTAAQKRKVSLIVAGLNVKFAEVELLADLP